MPNGDDSFFDELSRINNELVNLQRELAKKNAELREALNRIKTLEGVIPICMHCHNIRDDKDTWQKLERYLSEHSDAMFSHGLCPDCLSKHYPE
jgi:hypothetical protein